MRREESEWYQLGFTRPWFKSLDAIGKEEFLDALTDEELESWAKDWRVQARDEQLIPDGIWTTILANCGRGWGKTKFGNEFIKDGVERGEFGRVALVGQGEDDVREVAVEGESGLIAIASKGFTPKFFPSVGAGRLVYPNGAICFVYSAADPEALRGPQFHAGVIDEPMSFSPENRQKVVSNLNFGLRLGTRPRKVFTTTPKP